MKKLLTLLAIVALTGSVMAATATSNSKIETYVNKKIAPITQKEKDLNAKAEAQKQKAAQQQAEAKKKQEARKQAVQNVKNSAQATKTNTKKAIENEKNAWKNMLK